MDSNPVFDQYGQSLEPGEVLFREGESGDQMFIIQEGRVEIYKNIGGRSQVLAVLEKGEFFGEMAMVQRIQRTASARAAAPTKLLAFDRVGFQQMVEKNPKIALNIIDKLCRRLEQANLRLTDLAHTQTRAAIVAKLVLEPQGEAAPALADLQETWCRDLDLSWDILQAELALMAQEGLLDLGAGTVVVKDPKALQKLLRG